MGNASVFISYAHKDNESSDPDKRWLDRLLEYLHPLKLQNQVIIWSDKHIELGDNWREQIQISLEHARAAVLMISPSFMASEFIRNNELPVLLKNAKDRGVVIIPLILRRSLFQEVTFKYPDPVDGPEDLSLSSLQAANSPTQPLNALSESEQDRVLLYVAQRILQIVQSPSARRDSGKYANGKASLRRLAYEIADRREFGMHFNIFLGSACFLGSGDDTSKRFLEAVAGTDDYSQFCQAMKALSEDERNSKLRAPLLEAEIPSGYLALARLIDAGWFRCILTTNVDTFLERALAQVDIPSSSIRTLVVGETSLANILGSLAEPSLGVTVLKLCGDAQSSKFVLSGDEALKPNGALEKTLGNLFRRDTLIVGHGPGDPDLQRYINRKGDSIWVAGTKVNLNRELLVLLQERKSENNVIDGKPGAFDSLFGELDKLLSNALLSAQLAGGQDEDFLTIRKSAPSAENASDRLRKVKLLQLQQDLEQVHQVVDNLSASDPNRDMLQYQHSYERLRQEIDALSHAGEGTILGGFKIGERLGQGGVGSVYRAVHIMNNLIAAVKVMARDRSQDPTWRSRFFRGAKIMATLNHPNITRILDVGGIVGPWCYYSMELVDGPNLDVLLEAGTLAIEQKWAIAKNILEAMAYAHRGNEKSPIVHRDLKPSNVLINANGIAKITDFDMAFFDDPTVLTRTSIIAFGQTFYLAPELEIAPTIYAQRDPRADVFALGRILLRLFASIPPIGRLADHYLSHPDIFRFVLSSNVPSSAINTLSSLLQKATSFEPDNRFADAYEMLETFNRVEEAATVSQIDFRESLKIEFAEIAHGKFLMGSPDHEAEREDTEMLHEVEITSDFLLSKTPITQSMWSAVWGEAPPAQGEEHIPVEKASWYDAIGFCNALSVSLSLPVCYRIENEGILWDREADGFRLPTEAEWEYACRANSRSKYYLGDTEEHLSSSAWYHANCHRGPMPVAQKQPNGWGLCDMLGNVWEWCWDWFAPYSREDELNPIGPAKGISRTLRGGSWRRSAYHCRCAFRYESDPFNRGRSLGFRVARTIKRK
jgi:eukaryotic-like serine/threonine-protein kinase